MNKNKRESKIICFLKRDECTICCNNRECFKMMKLIRLLYYMSWKRLTFYQVSTQKIISLQKKVAVSVAFICYIICLHKPVYHCHSNQISHQHPPFNINVRLVFKFAVVNMKGAIRVGGWAPKRPAKVRLKLRIMKFRHYEWIIYY